MVFACALSATQVTGRGESLPGCYFSVPFGCILSQTNPMRFCDNFVIFGLTKDQQILRAISSIGEQKDVN
jgi:hypothetical protein